MSTFLHEKSAPLVELKTNSSPGEFTAAISAVGNVDRQGDKVMPGAFSKAINEGEIPPVYWAHRHDIPPIGEGLDWAEKDNMLVYTGRLFVKGDARHEWAEMVYAGMKSYEGRQPAIRQFSYSYGIPEGGAERVLEDGKAVRLLHQIFPVAEVGPCFLGANSETGLLAAAKSASSARELAEMFGIEFEGKAMWSDEYVDALPDTAFLLIEDGGEKDANGKTTRSLRHFPIKDADGRVDLPHVRKALSDISQSSLETKTRERVQAEARAVLNEIEHPKAVEFDFFQLANKEQWSQAYMDSLPDSAFLHVEMGGKKDDSGKTMPRTLRHFPYKDSGGQIDMPHLRDAIDRAPQATTLAEPVRERVQARAQRLLRAQEGKALLLGMLYSSKAWDDIEGYAVQTLLSMLDGAVSYIQMEPDPGDVAQMKNISLLLLTLLRTDFDEASSGNDAAKAVIETMANLYEKASETPVLSEATSKVKDKEIARLLLVEPTH